MKDEEKPILSGNFSAEDLARLMQTMSASQKDVMNEFAKTLAASGSSYGGVPFQLLVRYLRRIQPFSRYQWGKSRLSRC